jgi:NAD(P)-dependent dehydrogenase (short-subunit alcohol dehydrogenase family)
MKRALVTGATKGIGYAISARLVEKGYFVYMNYAHDTKAAEAIDFDKERYCVVQADLSTRAGAEHMAEVLKEGARLDCLVLNAGATCRDAFADMRYEDWARVMDTNVNIPFLLVQKLSGRIADGGSILFVGSDMGIYPHAASVPYGVSKAAVHMLARNLVKVLAPRRIRVNVVAPGFIDTEWQRGKPQWQREKIEDKIALKRFGRPEEVADACMGLIEGGYINGALLPVDGGYDYE